MTGLLTNENLRVLTTDVAVESTCPYCDLPGGTVAYAGYRLHEHCYKELGRELAVLDSPVIVETR